MKLGVSVHLGTINPIPLAWGIGCIVPQCTDNLNFICAIKQGGLGLITEVYNSPLAQLA